MIALAGPAQADSGDQCAQVQLDQTGSCAILGVNSFTNGSDAPPSGTNKSGNAGSPGVQAGSVTHTFQDPGSYYSVPEGLQPAALMGSYSRNGGEGGDASNGSDNPLPVQNLNAGNSGIGMPGGSVTFTSPTGAQVLFLGAGGQLGADSVAIWAESVGGNGGGGGLPTEGGLPDTSATGGAGGDVSVTVSNSASTFDPLTGGTGSILADGIGILARSTGGNGGVGANGGTGGGWGASGGEGATGGDGGPITILGSGGSIGTPGTNSPGILAQSIGGGGGSGGDPTGWKALGGVGETGWVEVSWRRE